MTKITGVGEWHRGEYKEKVDDLPNGSVRVLLLTESSVPPESIAECVRCFWDKLAEDAHILTFCGSVDNSTGIREALHGSTQVRTVDSHLWVYTDVLRKCEASRNGDQSHDEELDELTGDGYFVPGCEAILHSVKGEPPLPLKRGEATHADRIQEPQHHTERPPEVTRPLITRVSAPGDIVAVPFGGMGDAMFAAAVDRRMVWGCEADEEPYNLGLEILEGVADEIARRDEEPAWM